ALPSATVTHDTSLAAVQAQPGSAITEIRMLSGPRPASYQPGLMLVVHPASCRSVNVFPTTVTTAVRAGPLFAGISSRTTPLPDPLPPVSIVTQSAVVVAVHWHR